jgi:peptide/nickel transport system substrate-binding protein
VGKTIVRGALLLAAAAMALGVAGAGEKGGTLVFAGAADPTYLDPAIVSDGESFRVAQQIFEGLVDLKPGRSDIRPMLAKSWSTSKDGKTWTFQLQRGVKFHDGTPFNAAAVCANFNRWFNFSGPFQDASATYYYQAIFYGFKKNEVSTLGKPLYNSCRTKGRYTAAVKLNKKNGPFILALALPAFAMQSPTAMAKYGANQAEIRNGTFYPTGDYAFKHPTGTGPMKFQSWTVGQSVVLVKNKQYWGKSKFSNAINKLIIRPISNNTARLQALQTREINIADLLAPQDVGTVSGDSRLRVRDRPSFNVAYVTINSARPPTNNLLVRQAVAHGLDRVSVVRAFYGGRAVVAHEFMPPSLFGWAEDVKRYPYNPERSKQLLRQAGLTLPVEIEFWYPTGVTRPYMPDPKRNFEAFAASLAQSGFKVIAKSAPWRPDYVKEVNQGTAGNLNLIGWSGDYGDPDNFLGTFFQEYNPQFGFRNNKITSLLSRAEQETSIAKRTKLYQEANREIMKYLPGVPYAHTKPALGVEKRIQNFIPAVTGSDDLFPVTFGGQ